jgi:hypothetical protein
VAVPIRDAARDRIEQVCAAPDDERALRAAVLHEIRTVVPFDAYAWVLTDPVTCVGAAPLAEVPSLADLPRLIRLKYLTPVNRWTGLPSGRAATLVEATDGERTRSLVWRELLAGYGVHDVVSLVLRDRHGTWAFLDLWRIDARAPAFTPVEREFLESVLPAATAGLRAAVASTFALPGHPSRADGPVVLLLSAALAPQAHTPRTDDALRALLPTPPGTAGRTSTPLPRADPRSRPAGRTPGTPARPV